MSAETIKISIVVPIYNVEAYVRPCIESIIGQSYENLEIILVDDGSTDCCPAICDAYAKRDGRIRVIHKLNGGLVSARKAGAAAATGDYVLNVDGDDWIEKDRIEVLVRDGIMPTRADMVHLSGYIMDFEEDGKESARLSFGVPFKLFENSEVESAIFPLMLSSDIFWALWSWAIRRELLLKNQMLVDDRVVVGEDSLAVCFCLLDAKSVMTIQQSGYHYIQRASSMMHQANTYFDENFSRMKIWYQVMKNQLEQRHAAKKTREICGHIVLSSILNLDYGLLAQRFPGCLFPFPNVNSGARIVVYGAGKFGHKLIQVLSKIKKYSVVLWVDQNQNRSTVPGYVIHSRDAIFSADYDFIVVAIIDAIVSKDVKRALVSDGIPEEKIKTMDAGVISEDAIPDEIKGFQIQQR